jgi:hypothetical protein
LAVFFVLPVDTVRRENTLPSDRRELAFHQPAIRGRWRGSEFGLTEIKLKKGEPIERRCAG